MSASGEHFRNSVRTVARPLVSWVRNQLASKPVPAALKFIAIEDGPASGCQILVPSPSELAKRISLAEFESHGIAVVTRLINPEDICYDIGGHYGYYSLCMAKLAHKGQIHCFEPVPDLANRIQQSFSQSKIYNATVHNIAVAETVGEMELCFAAGSNSDDSMAYLGRYGGVQTERSANEYPGFQRTIVPARSLDSLHLAAPSFIKIDAEAAEDAILRGGLHLLQKNRPRLLIELHGVDLALRCAQILGELGYVGIAVGPRSLMMSVLWIHHEDFRGFEAMKGLSEGNLPILYDRSLKLTSDE